MKLASFTHKAFNSCTVLRDNTIIYVTANIAFTSIMALINHFKADGKHTEISAIIITAMFEVMGGVLFPPTENYTDFSCDCN
jgi:hypothetical protein